ncbi:MAG: methylenetetrahydrofolate reductase, partial [Muribaculaceae bacterium]|nr:methylenetetrahydrofolate reductase [Muribaculaceae bacterium]
MDIHTGVRFSYGVAGYPEKHEESPNAAMDIAMLKAKVDAGAGYIVTQMFFDNRHYFEFVDKCREAGINVPIIPGLKPIVGLRQLTLLPRVFKVDLPQEVAAELMKCRDDNEAKAVGVEWCAAQSRDLIAHGVKSIHYYSHNAVKSVEKVVKMVF